jgi:hypothetical protein
MSNSLVPKSNVFDRLRFDLSSSEKVKNFAPVMQSTNGNGAARMGHPAQNSNVVNSQGKSYSYHYCVRCLKRGHWRAQCHGSVVCHKCHRAGHFSSSCHGPKQEVGFTPKLPVTDCFAGKNLSKGKDIDISGWFQNRKQSGPTSPPPIFQSLTAFLQSLRPLVTQSPSSRPALDFALVLPSTYVPPPNSLSQVLRSSDSVMAYQLADPSPFMPRGFQQLQVQGHRMMTRACTRRALHMHED